MTDEQFRVLADRLSGIAWAIVYLVGTVLVIGLGLLAMLAGIAGKM